MKQTSETYVGEVLRTDCPVTPELIERISNPQTIRLLHAAMGMVTEAAELVDMLKKHLFYGRKLDTVNAKEELGDNQWYVGLAVDVLQTTFDDILTMNIDKLRLRYPEKFSEASAIDRDVAAERVLLEGEKPLSQRGRDWQEFSATVLNHIEQYTVPQYGDKGEDQASDYEPRDHVKQAKKYLDRFGKNSRPGQELLDILKTAHYVQMAHMVLEAEMNHKAHMDSSKEVLISGDEAFWKEVGIL